MNAPPHEPRPTRPGTAIALALGALSFSGLPALAQAADIDEAGARVLFAEGRRLAAAGNYLEACPKFEDSLRLDPGIGTSFNLADCLEHTGRTASAWARFLDVAAATKAAGQPDRERVARARALALEPKLSRLVIEVSSPDPGLVVTRDGIVLGAASWGSEVPVDPGHHLVEATAPGRKKWSASASVPDAPTTIVVEIPALEALPPDQPTLAARTAPPSLSLSPMPRGVGPRRLSAPVIALGALGAVALATGAVFAFEVQSENGDAKKLCPNGICGTHHEKANHDRLVADAYRDEKVAFISAGIGAVALLAAAYRWWRPAPTGSTKDTAPALSARPLAGGLGAGLEVVW